MEHLKNVPTWDEISATLKSKLNYSATTLERVRHTYNVFIGTCCSSKGGDAESIIKAGIKTAGILYEDGKISKSKLARMRSLAFHMLEYVQTGTISWKRVPSYSQQFANEEHECMITMFVQNEQRTHNHADSIISRDRCIIRIFLIYAEEHKISITEIAPSEMIEFLKYMQVRRPAGINSTVSALKHSYLFLIDMKLSDDHILPALKPWGHPRHKIYGLLTPNEKRQIIEAIDLTTETGKRDKAIFLLAIDCEIRSSDIYYLNP